MTQTEPDEGIKVLNLWVAANQSRINKATLSAMARVEGMSKAMTDLDVVGEQKTKEEINAIITASGAALAEFMGQAFEKEFSDVGADLRLNLKESSEIIVRNGREQWAALMTQKYQVEH